MSGTWIEYDGMWVQAFPDNEGGLWFYHPITGEEVHIYEHIQR